MPRRTQVRAESTPETAAPASSRLGFATETLVTRVPILAANGSLYAYELVGQSQADLRLDDAERSVQTRCLLHTVLNDIGLTELVADSQVMIAVSAANLVDEDYVVLPANRTILSVCTDAKDGEVPASAIDAARQAGYMVARSPDACTLDENLSRTDMLRIDISQATAQSISELLTKARAAGVQLLADHVDDQSAREAAIALGAQLLSGRYFHEPDVKAGTTLSGVKALTLQFLAAMNEKPIDFERVESAIKCDASLTVNLLRYLNSAALGVRERITSVRHAIRLLGEKPLRKWGSLVALKALADDKPQELLVTAIIRSRFCEELASTYTLEGEPVNYHLAGLLSVIDALVDLPIAEAIRPLSIESSVHDALIGESEDPIGCALAMVKACERGAWATVASQAVKLQLAQRQVANHYYQAVTWSNRLLNGVMSPHA